MAFLLASVIYIGDVEGNVWTLLYPSLFLLLAYEHERFKVSSFLTSKLALEHAIETERTKYEQEAMTVMAAREQEAKDREHEVLRSLIGNVAHDLKTPLQSVSMGLEGLKASITRLGFSNNHSASSSAAGK
jgi:signal transduction histidine kinase